MHSLRSGERADQLRRTPFVMLLLGLLGGGLVCLLVVNTTLDANSIEIRHLQQANLSKTAIVQQLRQQVAGERSAPVIQAEAHKLGMRPDPQLIFVNLRSGKITAGGGPTSRVTTQRTGTGPAVRARATTGPGR